MAATRLLNIGNTFSTVARWSAGAVHDVARYPTAELLTDGWQPELLAGDGWRAVGACVVPAVREQLSARYGERLQWLSATNAPGLDCACVDARTVGADRLANALAAVHTRPLPALIVDCGTAITIEVVDRQRRFRGGAILPGRLLLRRALHTGTAQLPAVPLADELPEPLGTTTRGAIRAGIDLGVVGAVERLLRETRAALNEPEAAALVVGGDRHYFAAHLPEVTLGPEDFTMRGLGTFADALYRKTTSTNDPELLL